MKHVQNIFEQIFNLVLPCDHYYPDAKEERIPVESSNGIPTVKHVLNFGRCCLCGQEKAV